MVGISLMGFILALALPLVIGITRHLSLPENWREPADSHTIGLGSSEPLTSATLGVRNEPDTPKLLVQSSPGISGEPAPIGLTLQGGRADGAVVIIRGLLPGMELSAGSAVAPDTWLKRLGGRSPARAASVCPLIDVNRPSMLRRGNFGM